MTGCNCLSSHRALWIIKHTRQSIDDLRFERLQFVRPQHIDKRTEQSETRDSHSLNIGQLTILNLNKTPYRCIDIVEHSGRNESRYKGG